MTTPPVAENQTSRRLNQREALAILGEGEDQGKLSRWESGKMVPRNMCERRSRRAPQGDKRGIRRVPGMTRLATLAEEMDVELLSDR